MPLTVSIPEKRAAFIADDSDAALIIAFHTDLLSSSELPRLSEDDLEDIIQGREDAVIEEKSWIRYDDMMALIYTSGSTGSPKGVINCLGDLENLFLAPEKYYIGGPGMRVMNNFSYMFSAHMQHVYRTMTLIRSAMHAVPGSIQKYVRKLMDYYLKVRPDYLGVIATTCAMHLTDSRFNEKEMPNLKALPWLGKYASIELTTVAG